MSVQVEPPTTCRTSASLHLPLKSIFCGVILAALLSVGGVSLANGIANVTITANPNILLADGRSKAILTVTLSDASGHTIPDGTQVRFSTNSGTIDPNVVISSGGVARTTLTSSGVPGQANVTASFISAGEGASGSVIVEFTNDSDLANTDQVQANWIRVTSTEYLAYGADSRTLDAAARNHGVHIAYRGLTIDANAAQVGLDANVVRAQQAILRRGTHPALRVDSLAYYLDSHSGVAIIANAPGQHTVQQVSVDGMSLATKPLVARAVGDAGRGDYDFQDLSNGHVLITAAAVNVQPHAMIQLARASIFIDSKKIVSMPNQVMPLSTDQVFGQQILGYGTDGIFVDVPYYATLSPSSTGMFSLRSASAAAQAGTSYSGRNGLAVDYDRTYQQGSRSGDLKLVGISRSDWGVRWTQSQRLWGGTQAYFFMDSPQHKSLFSSANLRHDFGPFSVNMSANDSRPIAGGMAMLSQQTMDWNVQSQEHLLFGGRAHGLRYSEEATYATATQRYSAGATSLNSRSVSHSFGLRFDTPAISLAKRTLVTDSLTVEQSYSDTARTSALNIQGTLQVNSQITNFVSSNLSYSYTHNPAYGPILRSPSGNNLFALYNAADKQNIAYTLAASAPNNRWQLSIASTYGLPTKDMTVGGGISYRLSSQMHLSVDNYLSHIAGYSYTDTDFSIAHRIGGRDLVVSWSGLMHRWRINLAPAQF